MMQNEYRVRRPNRRRDPELTRLLDGTRCLDTGKVRHYGLTTAYEAIRALRDEDGLNVYRCNRCNDFHVGHRP